MKATIDDVAKQAGVSNTSVSLAFQENSRISEKTRKVILKAARELNYAPNLAAKNLRYGKSNTIGFIVNDISVPFYSMMIKDAEGALEKSGFEMFPVSSGWNPEKEVKIIEKMIQMRVQGIIICLCEKNRKSIDLMNQYSIPHIAVDSYPDFYCGSYIANDFAACGRLMADHFINIGAERPGIINADKSMLEFSAFRKIFESFEKRLSDISLKVSEKNHIKAGLNIEAGKKAYEIAGSNGFDADAVFCANDLTALGFIEAAEKNGQKAGIDFAIAGIDDIEVSSFSKLSLTSIRQPYGKIAEQAVASLIDKISNSETVVKKELQPELIVRKTTSNFKTEGVD
jgi:LacI family transcriptional regulator